MYYLIWSDYDGHYVEQHKNKTELAKRLLEVARKERDDNYGSKVIAIIAGTTLSYDYTVDDINSMEKIFLDDELLITNKLPALKDRIEVDCPICGCMAGFLDEYIVKISGKKS